MNKLWNWCKKDAVLCIAIILAIISAFFVHPDEKYSDYIDFRTLAILFCLMAVMAGLQKVGLFYWVAEKLLGIVQHIRGIVFILVALCFFSSMLITNDVALITFVPFTFLVLKMVLGERADRLVVPVVVMQTISANLGSMLTPIGNPQNLYLYGKSAMGLLEFIWLMLPYTVLSFLMIVVWCIFFPYKGETKGQVQLEKSVSLQQSKKSVITYTILFLLCLLTVAHMVPLEITLILIVVCVFLMDKSIFREVDYGLLMTFVGFFIFIGNMGRITVFREFVQNIIDGNEILTAILSSQVMSNVPAALLLSGFTTEYEGLIIGTNLGGLGTLIASMASLISFKYIGKEYAHLRGKYLVNFTLFNVLFLVFLYFFPM